MIRKRTKGGIKCVPTHGKDYHGRPYTWLEFEWVDSSGTRHTGRPFLEHITGECMGFAIEPGDVLTVTVEVNAPE